MKGEVLQKWGTGCLCSVLGTAQPYVGRTFHVPSHNRMEITIADKDMHLQMLFLRQSSYYVTRRVQLAVLFMTDKGFCQDNLGSHESCWVQAATI